jgi:hypothetical protein
MSRHLPAVPAARAALACLLALAASGRPRAAEAAAASENPEEITRVRGLFDVDLPKTVEKFKAKVTVHPHFGDFSHRAYVRVPVGVRLGLNDRTELATEIESYLTHGLRGRSAGYGLDLVRLGGKYQFAEWLKPALDASVGLNTAFPVGRPPLDATDGHNHFSPYVTFSKKLPDHPRLLPFASFGTDLMWKSSTPGMFTENQPHSDSMGVSAGAFYDRDTFKYTLTASYWTTALIGRGDRHFFGLNPSVLWQLPRALTFHSKGQWIFGVGVKATHGPDGTDFGLSAKLRGEFKLSHLWKKD